MADPSDVTNAMRGHKAAISNPNVSEEAKEHSRQVLAAMEGKEKTGGSGGSGGSGSGSGSKSGGSGGGSHDDKKQHQQSKPKQTYGSVSSGGGGGGSHSGGSGGGGSGSGGSDETIDGKDPGNVARGLKASINNPNVSEEAKERAKEKLAELGQ